MAVMITVGFATQEPVYVQVRERGKTRSRAQLTSRCLLADGLGDVAHLSLRLALHRIYLYVALSPSLSLSRVSATNQRRTFA